MSGRASWADSRASRYPFHMTYRLHPRGTQLTLNDLKAGGRPAENQSSEEIGINYRGRTNRAGVASRSRVTHGADRPRWKHRALLGASHQAKWHRVLFFPPKTLLFVSA
jgi:hypothetical protein